MNAISNERTRQTKLLAAIAVLAMVVCALAVVMPAEDVQGSDAPEVPADLTSFDGKAETLKAGAAGAEINYGVSGDVSISEKIGETTAVDYVNIYITAGTLTITKEGLLKLGDNSKIYIVGGGINYYLNSLTVKEMNIYAGGAVSFTYPSSGTDVTADKIGPVGSSAQFKLSSGSITMEVPYTNGWGFKAAVDGTVSITAGTLSYADITISETSEVTVSGDVSAQGTVAITNSGTVEFTADGKLSLHETNGTSLTLTNEAVIVNNSEAPFGDKVIVSNDNGIFIDNTVDTTGWTNALSQTNISDKVTGGSIGTDGWAWNSTAKALALIDASVSGYYFEGDISTVGVFGENTITYNPNLAANDGTKDVIAAIKSTSALVIDGAGSLTINMDVSGVVVDGGMNNDKVSAIDANGVTVTCSALTINVTGKVTESSQTYTNVTGQITGGNRGIQIGAVALSFDDCGTADQPFTISGGEKAVQAKTDGSSVTIGGDNGSNVAFKLFEPANENIGMNDRWGLKAQALIVSADSTLTTDGLRITGMSTGVQSSTESTVSGTLHITYYEGAGLSNGEVDAFPAGIILASDREATGTDVPYNMMKMSVAGEGQIIIDANNAIAGEFAADDGKATFGAIATGESAAVTDYVNAVKVTSTATLSVGSLDIDGGFDSGEGDASIVLEGEQELTGTYDGPVTVKNGATIIVPAGETATFNGPVYFEDSTTFNAIGNVGGSGQLQPAVGVSDASTIEITSTNPSSLQKMVSGLTVTENNSTADADDTKTLEELSKTNTIIVLTKNYNVTGNEEIPSTVTIYLNGHTLGIAANGTLELNGATVRTGFPAGYASGTTGGSISVATDGTLTLDGADVYAPVDADTENGATVVLKNTKSYTISNGTITSPIEVGYGNTVNAESITVQSGLRIDVYGNFNVAGSLRITDGTFTVYQGGTATVSGNLNIASDAVIDGVLNVNSNVTVQGSGSDADFTVGATGEVNVASGATFTVARGNSVVTNTLTVVSGGEFNVEGTLAMNGTLSGAVNAYGTVQMNGVIATGGATVNLFDGTSITVTSISGGALTITDKNAAKDYAGDLAKDDESNLSQGNSVKLTPGTSGTSAATIGGITVSVEVTQFVYEGDGYYISDMTIGGTIVSSVNGGKVDVTGATGTGVIYNADGEKRTGYVYVNDMALSAGTALTFENGSVFVDGTLDATAKDNSKADADLSITAGTVTVNGMIQTLDKITANINAGHYETLVDTTTINNYVSADAAIAAIGQAQMNQVTFYGETTVTADATIPANALVTIVSGAVLNVDAVLTIADNAYVTNEGTIQVDDTLVITNYLATINSVAGIKADVMTESGDDRTYMSLAAAMASGATEIVLNQTVTVEKDLTIPEGVTVTSDQWGFKVNDDVTLTVDGAIELTGRTAENKIVLAENSATPDDKAELVVNGHVSYAVPTTDPLATIQGAHFTKRVDGLNTQFISNVGYAAENCSEGTVTIYGNVTAGDVTFTAAENKQLTIIVANISATEKSTLTVGTLTLVGAALDLATTPAPSAGYGTVTGTVSVSAADAVVGSIDADKATGFRLAAGSETTAEGTTNYAYLTGKIVGDVTVSAGTVTVGAASGTVSLTVAADSTLTVASGATLALAANMTVETATGVTGAEDDAVLTVDGTITVGEGAKLTINGDAVVNGTMDVLSTEDGQGAVDVATGGTLDVAGAVTVGTYNDKDATFTVKGVMSVGTKPTTLGAGGSAAGTYVIDTGAYVKVYAGADVTGAEFVISSTTEAESTQYLINGSEYMTVYANGVGIYSVIDAEVFEISGIQNGVNFDNYTGTADNNGGDTGLYLLSNWFTNESMAANTVLKANDQIGKVSAVYAKAEAADVVGTVSEGDGLTLYIDNVPISASSAEYPLSVGTHTVAFSVQAGYNGDNAVITFNGQTVQSGGSITITADMDTFTLTVTGAVPATSGGSTGTTGGDDGMGLTDYLLIVLVILIVIMAIIVALRLMRS